MYSSDMQEAYSALVRGTKASAQCSEEGRRQGQWQGKRAVEDVQFLFHSRFLIFKQWKMLQYERGTCILTSVTPNCIILIS